MKPYNGFSSAERTRAGNWLRKRWAQGIGSPPIECCACGQTRGVIYAHAEDYSEPYGDHLERYPLCYRCHIMWHCRFWRPEAVARYVQDVLSGKRFSGCSKRSFH